MDVEMKKRGVDKRGTRAHVREKLVASRILCKPKRSQVTIFIILAIVIVVIIASFFIIRNQIEPGTSGTADTNPALFLETCIEPKVKEAIDIMLPQGGYIGPELFRNFKFSDESEAHDIAYLCYNQNYYASCINQEPMLIKHLKDEIKDYISGDVEDCFDELENSLKKRGYVVESSFRGFDIEMVPKKILIDADADINYKKSGSSNSEEDFMISIPSTFYDVAIVVQEIVSQEAKFCDFDHLSSMMVSSDFEIDKFRTGDADKIYGVQHRDSKEKFRFAVKGCVIPPGF